MNDTSIIASYLRSPSSKFTNPGITSQLELLKYRQSDGVNDFLTKETKPVFLNNNLLTFRVIDKKFELQGDL